MIDNMLIRSQQYMLAVEGFYNHKIDGVWGSMSQTAMRSFSNKDNFKPAKVRGEFSFFIPYSVLPKGYTWGNVFGQRSVILRKEKGSKVSLVEWLTNMEKACVSGTSLNNKKGTDSNIAPKDQVKPQQQPPVVMTKPENKVAANSKK